MSETFTTDNIDHLTARMLGDAWEITFRSGNEGMCHQLYVNGRLGDWTDSAEVRRFLLKFAQAPCEVAVAAVDRRYRRTDYSGSSAALPARPNWTTTVSVARTSGLGPLARLALLGYSGDGQIDPVPLDIRDAWPAWIDRRPWARGPFGLEGGGMGGLDSPGLGLGAFGAGEFGLDADLIALEAKFRSPGVQRLIVRAIGADGEFADSEPFALTASPPPLAPVSLRPAAYDPRTDTLTLAFALSADDDR